MDVDPCEREKQAAREAGEEWHRASRDTGRFVVMQPLDPTKDIAPLTPEEFEEMSRAYDRFDQAWEAYREAMIAWMECQDRRR